MKASILNLRRGVSSDSGQLSTSVSFRKFIDYLKDSIQIETGLRQRYLENALEILIADTEFSAIETMEQAIGFENQLEVVFQLLSPTLHQQERIVWAIGMPMVPVMFYGTDSFYEMVLNKSTGELKSEVISEDAVSVSEYDKLLPIYSLILLRLYGIATPGLKPMVIRIKDQKSGLPQYFQINFDHRFTDVYPIKPLPEINANEIKELLAAARDLKQLLILLPVNTFRFEGISIVTLTDVTTVYALEQIRKILLEMHVLNNRTIFGRITDSLRILVANPDIDFGFIPNHHVNSKLIIDQKRIFQSKLLTVDMAQDVVAGIYLLLVQQFERNPDTIFTLGQTTANRTEIFIKALENEGIQYYLLMPVFNKGRMVGLLEVYSKEKMFLEEEALSQISLAKPLISRVFQNVIDSFNARIDTVIKEKFTSIQEAVEWKFQQAAWHFIRDSHLNQNTEPEKIIFEDVYPLYGAIDIRNSTSVREACLRKDLLIQFDLIGKILEELLDHTGLIVADALLYKCRNMVAQISNDLLDLDEMKVIELLQADIHPFLRHFVDGISDNRSDSLKTATKKAGQFSEQIKVSIQDYFESIQPEKGKVFQYRKELEKSMRMINSSVSGALNDFQLQVQPLYPAYFETFRTDGIEYDIYIGQAIDPDKKFSSLYLNNVKLWQISSMAAITRLTHSLLAAMKTKLETTQLIFVNSNTIDVTFRIDERRFDVEGAYNIRYQVIKKRIDKVHIKNTTDRLTQPGKIALVYFQGRSITDYLDYIYFLQSQHILCDDLEYLELEELQGVSGLRALRVGVNLDPPPVSG